MSTSDELADIPKGYDADKTYIYPSNPKIDADKAYYYYKDGNLDYVVVESKSKADRDNKKYRKYIASQSASKKIVNILEGILTPFSYNKDEVAISLRLETSQTARTYSGIDQFAVLIGVLA